MSDKIEPCSKCGEEAIDGCDQMGRTLLSCCDQERLTISHWNDRQRLIRAETSCISKDAKIAALKAELKVMSDSVEAMQSLLLCYRLQKSPSMKLLDKLDRLSEARAALRGES